MVRVPRPYVFCKGGYRCRRHNFCGCANQIAHAFQVPALCEVRKGRGTHYLAGASEVKSLGHPPCAIYGEGAPSLRFLQGRVTMLPTQLLRLCNHIAHAFHDPALCKVRKGRGTHYLVGASEVKSLGHPPDTDLQAVHERVLLSGG